MASSSLTAKIFAVVNQVVPAVILLGLGIGGAIMLFAMSPKPAERTETVRAPKVNSITADRFDGAIMLEARGVVVPHRELFLSAEVPGVVKTKNPLCQAGRFVAKDTELLVIDQRELQLEVRRIEAEVRQADVQIQELDLEVKNLQKLVAIAERDVELQTNDFQRIMQLRDRGTASVSQVETAERNLNQSRNSLLQSQNQASLLLARRDRLVSARDLQEIQLERAQLDLDRCVIKAPSDGVIVSEQVEQGSYVQPGTQLIAFEDTTKVEVEFTLRVEEAFWLLQDRSLTAGADANSRVIEIPPIENVEISFDLAGKTLRWRARLEGLARHGVDERTRNLLLRAVVDVPATQSEAGVIVLQRDMFVNVVVPVYPRVDLISFPASALRAGNQVWVVRDSKLNILPVRIAGRSEEIAGRSLTAVSESLGSNTLVPSSLGWVIAMQEPDGLLAGDRVVSSPLLAPFEGMALEDVGSSSLDPTSERSSSETSSVELSAEPNVAPSESSGA